MRQIILAVAIIFTISGCSVYSKFKAPKISTANLCGEHISTSDTLSGIKSWREVFTDANLRNIIDKALTTNSDLRIARMNIEQAEATLRASKWAYAPSFSLAPEGGLSKAKGENTVYTYQLPITTQWEIDLSGKLRNSKEQARANLLQSEEYADMVKTQLISAIANSYYTLIMLDEQLRLTNASIENQRENLEAIKSMKEVGLQTEVAVNQAEVSYYEVLSSVSDLNKQIRLVENTISLLTNETPHTIARSSMTAIPTLMIDDTAPIPLSALALRPDVKVAEYALMSNHYGVNMARSEFYPSLTLSGSLGWTNNLGVVTNPGSLLLSALGSLTQPLFNRGTNRANLKIAQSQYEQTLIGFEKSLLVAGSEVNDALTACQAAAEKMEWRKKQVQAGKTAYENSKELMKHGSATYLEVLIAQSASLQSELRWVSDWFERVQGQINLYKALGGR